VIIGDSLLVTQPLTRTVAVFDGAGNRLGTFGGSGGGPGEFGAILGAGVLGDTIWIADIGRIHRFSAHGDRLGTTVHHYVLPPPYLRTGWIRPLASGYYLTSPGIPLAEAREGSRRVLFVHGPDDDIEIEVTAGPLPQRASQRIGGQPLAVPLTLVSSFAVSPDGHSFVAVDQELPSSGDLEAFVVHLYSPRGRLLRTATVPFRPVPVARPLPEAVSREQARITRQPESTNRQLDLPDYYYPVARVVLAPDTSIWLQRQGPADLGWWILDKSLELRGRVTFPAGFRVLTVHGRDVWGVSYDDLDVSYVVKYRVDDIKDTGHSSTP
jgi:hypothetical protein